MRSALVLTLLFAACSSTPVAVPSDAMRPDERVVGTVHASAGGFQLLQLFPLGMNSRFETALDRAKAEVSKYGGDARLANVKVWESWYWAWIGVGHTFHVDGDAVKKATP